MRLAFEARGAGRPMLLLHGFTQTRRSWEPLWTELAEHFSAQAVDLPGHGASTAAMGSVEETAAWLARALPGPAILVGYSMGGRIALRQALDHPATVERLVLIGASPGIEDPEERAARRALDRALADRIERLGVDRFLDEWLAQPMFAGLSPAQAGKAARMENQASGLAAALRSMGTGEAEPLWGRLKELRVPVLLVTGERDPKFGAIADELRRSTPAAVEHAVISGVGHAAHLEAPGRFLSLLLAWLAQ